jgi:branched-chain amino acid transport system substrate-binding protein
MAAPLRVGILNDTTDAPSEDPMVGGTIEPGLRLAIDDLTERGRLDRPVEFVSAYGLGLPEGTARAVERAYAELVDQGVLAVMGPAIGDNALVATPLADAARIPTINWAGTERGRSEYMFHLQVGSHEDESILLARHLESLGLRRIGVVFDRSPIGRRYAAFFETECEVLGLELAARTTIAPLASDATREVGALRAAGVDGVVYLGLGLCGQVVARARAAAGWDVPAAMNTAGMRGYDPDYAREVDGWTYVDMHSDENPVLERLRDRLGIGVATGALPAVGYDLGQLLAEGLARATEHTAAGVHEGLELVKLVPAAMGHRGTTLGFGHWDRGALHGEYLVLREWRGGESIEITAAPE